MLWNLNFFFSHSRFFKAFCFFLSLIAIPGYAQDEKSASASTDAHQKAHWDYLGIEGPEH